MRQPTTQDYLDTLKAVQNAGFFSFIRDCYARTGELISYKLLETRDAVWEIENCTEYDTLKELRDDMVRIAKDFSDRYHYRGHNFHEGLQALKEYSVLQKGIKL